ncbi:MAG: hypothetical protein U1E76_02665 [Planctomycetota bacterium]
MRQILGLSLASLSLIMPIAAGQPLLWHRHFDGSDGLTDMGFAVTVDGAGNVITAGSSVGLGTGQDFIVVKYDRNGHTLWSQRYDGPGHSRDMGWNVVADRFGNVIVLGDSIGNGTDNDIAIVKYAPDGQFLWTRRYDGPEHGWDGTEGGRNLTTDGAGNVLVCGTSYSSASDYDVITMKLSPAGTLMWLRRYDGPLGAYDDAFGIAVDAAGDIYVGGDTQDASGVEDIMTLKYDANGNLLWQRQYGTPQWDGLSAMTLDGAGNLLVTGFVSYPSEDYVTLKYDASGSLLWARTYDGPEGGWDVALAIATNRDGNVCVTGESANHYDSAYATVMYDAGGKQLWAQRYEGSYDYYGADAPGCVDFDQDGNLYVTGLSWGGVETGMDVATLKYAHDGTLLWEDRFDGPVHGDDGAAGLVLDRNGDVYVVGVSMSGADGQDVLVLKYAGSPRTFVPSASHP